MKEMNKVNRYADLQRGPTRQTVETLFVKILLVGTYIFGSTGILECVQVRSENRGKTPKVVKVLFNT
uniref:Uncharacterized protein n=1 Tax=Octopus bimaculoides TaxID=37653 RepID=A0A0L8FUM4_OCTBM